MPAPLVSIIITNRNGKKYIVKCMESVLDTDYPNFEIILVDNASTDGSIELVKETFADHRIKIIRNETDRDFVGANNIGISNSSGDYLVLLSNDTQVKKDWLNEIVSIFEKDNSVGVIQIKLLKLDDKSKIDTCGHYFTIFGFPYEIGVGQIDNGRYDHIYELFGARGAALPLRRKLLDKIGYLDEDYIIYGEDTDLSWRCWLSGFKVALAPKAIVYHKGGGTLNKSSLYRVFYHGTKNNIRTLIKNLSFGNLLWMLPLHISCRIIMVIFFILKRRISDASWVLKGILWNTKNLRQNLEERYRVQHSIRKVSDAQIFSVMFGKLSLPQIIKKGFLWIGRI